jgi:hypothetical protein
LCKKPFKKLKGNMPEEVYCPECECISEEIDPNNKPHEFEVYIQNKNKR